MADSRGLHSQHKNEKSSPPPSTNLARLPKAADEKNGGSSGKNQNFVDHTYHDFSRYFEQGGEAVAHKKAGKNFPAILHQILSDPHYSHIITWMPHGRAFRVLDKKLLLAEVLPTFFGMSRFESFTRQLSGWDYKRLHRPGPDFGCYYNQCFLRGDLKLTWLMRRGVKSSKGKPKPSPSGEPDFYDISRRYPLPPPTRSTATMTFGSRNDGDDTSVIKRRAETVLASGSIHAHASSKLVPNLTSHSRDCGNRTMQGRGNHVAQNTMVAASVYSSDGFVPAEAFSSQLLGPEMTAKPSSLSAAGDSANTSTTSSAVSAKAKGVPFSDFSSLSAEIIAPYASTPSSLRMGGAAADCQPYQASADLSTNVPDVSRNASHRWPPNQQPPYPYQHPYHWPPNQSNSTNLDQYQNFSNNGPFHGPLPTHPYQYQMYKTPQAQYYSDSGHASHSSPANKSSYCQDRDRTSTIPYQQQQETIQDKTQDKQQSEQESDKRDTDSFSEFIGQF